LCQSQFERFADFFQENCGKREIVCGLLPDRHAGPTSKENGGWHVVQSERESGQSTVRYKRRTVKASEESAVFEPFWHTHSNMRFGFTANQKIRAKPQGGVACQLQNGEHDDRYYEKFRFGK
jgi:hypothetical protein